MQNMNFINPFDNSQSVYNNLPTIDDIRNAANINLQLQQQQNAAPVLTNEQAAANAIEYLNQANARPQVQGLQKLEQRGINPLDNALKDVQQIGTGLVYAGTHIPETLGQAVGWVGNTFLSADNYYKNNGNLLRMGVQPLADIHDFLLSNYDIKASDYEDILKGKQTVGQVLGRGLLNAYTHPVLTGLDLLGLKGIVKPASAAAKATTATKKVEAAINTTTAKVRKGAYGTTEKLNEFSKNFDNAAKLKAIEALEEGIELEKGAVKQATKQLAKAVDEYDKFTPEWAKINNFELAHNQRLLRKGKVNSVVEGDKMYRPYFDIIKEEGGLDYLKELSKTDSLAADVLKSKELFDKGYLKLVPHGLAEVTKDATGKILAEEVDRLFAGNYSTRVFGGAKYQDILNQLAKSPEWLDGQLKKFVEGEILNEMQNNGTLGGHKLVDEATKKIVYIEPVEDINATNLSRMLETATDTPITEKAIAIDEKLATELKNQLNQAREGRPFGNTVANDIWGLAKQNTLATAGYLAGNFQTGLANAIINAGLNPVTFAQDFAESIATKGKLAKEAGIYRELIPSSNKFKTPIIKQIANINKPLADALQATDIKMQNTFAEMALHNNLRSKGISVGERANAIADMDKINLANTIKDAKAMALINPTTTILPAKLHGIVSMSNPFWRWVDTAAQSSIYTLNKHPIVSDLIFNKFATDMFNEEVQNRLNLGVKTDKPFVSFRYNPKTKNLEEVSMEFVPQLNTLKTVGEMGQAIKDQDYAKLFKTFGTNAVPFFGAVAVAATGKDKFGRPLVRPEVDRQNKQNLMYIQGDKRYKYIKGQGLVEVESGMADEILNAALNEVIAYPKFINRTLAPAVAGVRNLLGDDVRYYKPYANQVFGEFAPTGEMPVNANPRSSAAGTEFMDILGGAYARRYDLREDIERPMSKQQTRSILKGGARRQLMNNMILNRFGGQ